MERGKGKWLVEFRVRDLDRQYLFEAFDELEAMEICLKLAERDFGPFSISDFLFVRAVDFTGDKVYYYPDGGIQEMTQ